MEKEKIERINFLARKAKEEGLTDEEKTEQQALRSEYRAGFRQNFMSQLNSTYYIDPKGNRVKVTDRSSEKKEEKQ